MLSVEAKEVVVLDPFPWLEAGRLHERTSLLTSDAPFPSL